MKVIGIKGQPINTPGHVDPDIVKLAEDILERAKSGDLVSLSMSLMHSDGANSNHHVGMINFSQIGSLYGLVSWMSNKYEEAERGGR